MPIVIGQKPSLLNNAALGLESFIGGYGAGYGSHSGELQQAQQAQINAFQKPLQQATQNAYNWMQQQAYQQQSFRNQVALKDMAHANAMEKLGTQGVDDFSDSLYRQYGIVADPNQLRSMYGGTTSSSGGTYSCGPNGCGYTSSAAPATSTTTSGAEQIPIGGFLGTPSLGGHSTRGRSSQATDVGLPPAVFQYDPSRGSYGDQLQSLIQERQQQIYSQQLANKGLEMRVAGETPEEVKNNQSTWSQYQAHRAAIQAQTQLPQEHKDYLTPAQATYGINQITTPEILSIAPAARPRLQSPEQHAAQVKQDMIVQPLPNGEFAVNYGSGDGKRHVVISRGPSGSGQQQNQQLQLPPGVQMQPDGSVMVDPGPPQQLGFPDSRQPPTGPVRMSLAQYMNRNFVDSANGQVMAWAVDKNGALVPHHMGQDPAIDAAEATSKHNQAYDKLEQDRQQGEMQLRAKLAADAVKAATVKPDELNGVKGGYDESAAQRIFDMLLKSSGLTPASQPSATPPAIGEVRRGYRYRGGDPASQSSWEKVQ